MSTPTQRGRSGARNQRRSHHGLIKKHTRVCAECGAARLPHTACPKCGVYRGKKTKT